MWLRLLAVFALVSGSLAALAPTVCPSLDVQWLPESRLQFSPTLQGGTELVMEVQRDEAVRAEVDDDVAYLRYVAAATGQQLSVRIVAGSGLEIVGPAPQNDVVEFVDANLGSYDHVLSVDQLHRFELSERRRQAIYQKALVHTTEVIEGRVRSLCVDWFSVEHIGDGVLVVQWTGEDPARQRRPYHGPATCTER